MPTTIHCPSAAPPELPATLPLALPPGRALRIPIRPIDIPRVSRALPPAPALALLLLRSRRRGHLPPDPAKLAPAPPPLDGRREPALKLVQRAARRVVA